MESASDIVNISYDGSNPLVAKVLGSYKAVIDTVPWMKEASQPRLWAASASALFDLSSMIMEDAAGLDISASFLGIDDKSIKKARPLIYDAVRFVSMEVMQRWYNSLKSSGLPASNILASIKKIKKRKLATTKEIVDLMEETAGHVAQFTDLSGVRPEGGWRTVAEDIEFERLVRKGAIRLGQYL